MGFPRVLRAESCGSTSQGGSVRAAWLFTAEREYVRRDAECWGRDYRLAVLTARALSLGVSACFLHRWQRSGSAWKLRCPWVLSFNPSRFEFCSTCILGTAELDVAPARCLFFLFLYMYVRVTNGSQAVLGLQLPLHPSGCCRCYLREPPLSVSVEGRWDNGRYFSSLTFVT